jgi:transaldolase
MEMKMNQDLMESIKQFVLEGIELGKPVLAVPNEFWKSLAATGTEIWLDTGDIDEASALWCKEMTALTTNNTLLNKEIQKGIYDDLIVKANDLLSGLDMQERIIEIAFILNARHGLKLVETFGGKVSVELHTDMAHDIERSVWYAERFYDICPSHFIIKIPLTPSGYIATRRIREKGIPVNFTLNFSARQNLIAALFSKPSYVNIFLGRQNAFVQNNGLGDGLMVGEKSTMASQRVVTEYSKNNPEPTLQIAASMRDASQVASLAGVDVFTIPTAVTRDAMQQLQDSFRNNKDKDYAVHMNIDIDLGRVHIEKLWNYSETEHNFAHSLDDQPPVSAEEFVARAHEAGLVDMFPKFSADDLKQIAADGKIPVYKHWEDRIASGQVAIDTLLNAAGLASFSEDQSALDARIKGLIM